MFVPADSINARGRLAAENDRLHEECALLREELRIKDARTAQIVPQRRPHYPVGLEFVIKPAPLSTPSAYYHPAIVKPSGIRTELKNRV
jgi:hypothetical protein